MIRIAFCDDSREVLNEIDSLLPEMSRGMDWDWDLFASGGELLSHLRRGEEAYHIYVLDIEMPDIDGIQVAGKIREQDKTAVILFLTDYKEYVYQVFEVLPFRFLEKPVDTGRLRQALEAAVAHIRSANTLFFFQVGHKHLQWPTGDIRYFESRGRKVTLFATQAQFTFYGRCDEIMGRLDRRVFARPHVSYIVNMECIRSIRQDEMILAGDLPIPISKRCRSAFAQEYMRFVERRNGIT